MGILSTILESSVAPLVSGAIGSLQANSNRHYNERMWHMNNEYNSPKQQVQRAIDAGINPNSLFSNGYSPVSTSNLQATPETNVLTNSSNLLGSLTSNALAIAQADKLESETDLNKYELTWNKMTEKQRYDSLLNMNEKSKAEIAKIFSDIGINDFNKDMQEKTFRWFAMKSEAEIKVMQEQLNVLRNQSLDILKGIELKDANIKQIFSSIALQDRQREFYDTQERGVEADIALKSAQTASVQAQTDGQKISNAIQDVVRKFSEFTGIPVNASESQALFALWSSGKFNEASDMIMLNAANRPASNPFAIVDKFFNSPEQYFRQLFKDIFQPTGIWTK